MYCYKGYYMNSKFFKRTKIVATIGPAVDSPEGIQSLIDAGVNIFRLNTSHGTMEDHVEKFKTIRSVCEKNDSY